MGVVATLVTKGLGHQNPTIKLAHWMDILDQPFSLAVRLLEFEVKPLKEST